MPITLHTYEDVQLHVTCLLFDKQPPEPGPLRIEKNLFADIFINTDGHIEVSTYASLEDFYEWESLDGGGICMLWNDDNEDFTCAEDDPEYIDNIRKNWTPEQLAQCIQDKALFVWQLIHSA